jgi:histidinol-phosphate aminotransferase
MERAARRVEPSAFEFPRKSRLFETGHPHRDVAAALNTRGIEIGRAFPPLDNWARISIGLPQENALARDTIAGLLR